MATPPPPLKKKEDRKKDKRKKRGATICNPHMLHEPQAVLKALGLPIHGSIGRFSYNI